MPFLEACVQSFTLICATELGDRTFFIVALLAIRHKATPIVLGATLSAWVMTILTVAIGKGLQSVVSEWVVHLVAAVLFFGFGLKMFVDAWKMAPSDDYDELSDVERELEALDGKSEPKQSGVTNNNNNNQDEQPTGTAKDNDNNDLEDNKTNTNTNTNNPNTSNTEQGLKQGLKQGWIEPFRLVFVLTFLGEWGDRSQVGTIALSASKNATGVIVGSFVAHAICNVVAAQVGRLLSLFVTERVVCVVGGLLFVCFGMWEVWEAI